MMNMTETSAECVHCGLAATVSTPDGSMCGGHAMVESARRWNLREWDWSVVVHTSDEIQGAALTALLDPGRALGRLSPAEATQGGLTS